MTMKYDLFCFGKANTDYVAYVPHELLNELKIKKSCAKEVSTEFISDLEKQIKNMKKLPGGSTANVAHGFANLSRNKCLKVAYATSIGTDENGKNYEEHMKASGIDCYFKKIEGNSPVCIALVTPDAERTFIFSPGVSTQYFPEDLPYDLIHDSKIFHTDAYEIASAKNATLSAITFAKQEEKIISFDLANEHIIEKHSNHIHPILKISSIVFANKDEFVKLTNSKNIEEDAQKLRNLYNLDSLIVKLGSKGALICDQELHKIDIFKTHVVDTNGAGDAFAAGFLYGLMSGYKNNFSGKIGSYYASKVVSVSGPRFTESINNIEEMIK